MTTTATSPSTADAPVSTVTADNRRSLRFARMSELLADVEQFDAETVAAGGNWTPAQIVQHVDKLVRISLDGTDVRAPWYIRAVARLMKSSALNKPMKPGFKLPKRFDLLLPDADVSWEDAVGGLRESIGRIRSGERMTHSSPVFGPLAHEEWEQLHCRHAEMHFGFLSMKEA